MTQLPNYRVKSLKTPIFGGVNRRFQAKLPQSKNMQRPYYRNYCIDSNQICTAIKTAKCRSWVVRTHVSQVQDGGRPPSWKNRKIAIIISATFRSIATKFGIVTRVDPLDRADDR